MRKALRASAPPRETDSIAPPVPPPGVSYEIRDNPGRQLPDPPPAGLNISAEKWAVMNRAQRRDLLRRTKIR